MSKVRGCKGTVVEVINETLVAFCKIDSSKVSKDDVRAVCKQWLPAYMIPSEVVLKSELPYLASGKIDRSTLRAEYEVTSNTIKQAELPTGTQLEQYVASCR